MATTVLIIAVELRRGEKRNSSSRVAMRRAMRLLTVLLVVGASALLR